MSAFTQSLLTLLALIFGSVSLTVAVFLAIAFDWIWLEDQ
jgi:hypothetical protein